MSDEYKVRNINLDKLADHVRSQGQLSEEAALHLMDTIRCLRTELATAHDLLMRDVHALRDCVANETKIENMRFALERIRDIDQDHDAKKVGHYLLKKKCKIIAKEALAESV